MGVFEHRPRRIAAEKPGLRVRLNLQRSVVLPVWGLRQFGQSRSGITSKSKPRHPRLPQQSKFRCECAGRRV